MLVGAEELLLEEGDTLDLVVGEEAGDLGPDGARGVAVADDRAEDLGGDGLVEPADDGRVESQPVGVVRHGEEVDGAVDMIKEIILAEEEAEVRLPREEFAAV